MGRGFLSMLLRLSHFAPASSVARLVLGSLGLLMGACGADGSASRSGTVDASLPMEVGGPPLEAGADVVVCAFNQVICEGHTEKVCNGTGGFLSSKECERECHNGTGCEDCVTGDGACQNGLATVCDANRKEVVFACEGPGTRCEADGCKGPCSPTVLGRSNVGCDFWPTVTANNVASSPRDVSQFGVWVGNPSDELSAMISVEGVRQFTLGPKQVYPISLPLIPDLKGPDWAVAGTPMAPSQSVNKLGAAYHLQSDLPIVAYQFNTIEPQAVTSTDSSCMGMAGAPPVPGSCYSYSVDASTLFPSHVLSSEYFVASYRAWQGAPSITDAGVVSSGIGDFLAITAVEDNTSLTLGLPSSALPWAEGVPLVAGQPSTLSMAKGQVVELFTDGSSSTNSFSGAKVSVLAKRRVQVITGSACGAVPGTMGSSGICGHMEDLVLPTDSLGKEYVLIPPGDPLSATPYSVRIHALADTDAPLDAALDGTTVEFDPASHKTTTIAARTAYEVNNLTTAVVIRANHPIAVQQYASSRGGPDTNDPYRVGGPTQLTVVPTERYLTKYYFVASSSPSFRTTYLQINAATGDTVTFDKNDIKSERFMAIGASGRSFAVLTLSASENATVHVIESHQPIGIVVQGVGPYSSYMYAGGMGL
jgi:hypothetical protein